MQKNLHFRILRRAFKLSNWRMGKTYFELAEKSLVQHG